MHYSSMFVAVMAMHKALVFTPVGTRSLACFQHSTFPDAPAGAERHGHLGSTVICMALKRRSSYQ